MSLVHVAGNRPMLSRLRSIPLFKPIFNWREEQRFRQSEEKVNRLRVEFIDKILPKNGVGAELGVFKGFFSPLLLEKSQAKQLHLIDPWYFLTPNWHWGGGNRSTVDALVKILQKLKPQIDQGTVRVHVGDDCQVLSTFPDGHFDWAYIDSSHQYEHTVKELEILKSKVKIGGVISGDDWQPDASHPHHGVYRAVTEFVQATGYEILYASQHDRQWALRKS